MQKIEQWKLDNIEKSRQAIIERQKVENQKKIDEILAWWRNKK